jgi:outer membrane biosynthesis protein TonB
MKKKFDIFFEEVMSKLSMGGVVLTEAKRLTLKKLLGIPVDQKISDVYENTDKGGKELALAIIDKIKSGDLEELKAKQEEEESKEPTEIPDVQPEVPETTPEEEPTPEPEVTPEEPEEENSEEEIEDEDEDEDEDEESDIEEDADIVEEEGDNDMSPEDQAEAYIARVMNLPWAGDDNVYQKAYTYLTKVRQKI